MRDILISAMKNKKLIAIYSDDFTHFSVGYVLCVSKDQFVSLNIGIYGDFDGYSLSFIENILRIETESIYLNKIELLSKVEIEESTLINTNDCLSYLINTAITNEYVVAVRLNGCEDEVKGYIQQLHNDSLTIIQFNDYGDFDGKTAFELKNIEKLIVNDIECAQIDKLYRLKH